MQVFAIGLCFIRFVVELGMIVAHRNHPNEMNEPLMGNSA